ncbi:hypothetical protein BP5796_12250 [Coleophoma crateriformis]|uniref:RelA/SpoT domain-containing protein n=1 Tax=Coleophoma crateriformis TaxID=565419 RepID=A0A3D8Q9H9_9HELO|nr:hypothetical protein BP5796_12250 [Coleophoma crateriformis]
MEDRISQEVELFRQERELYNPIKHEIDSLCKEKLDEAGIERIWESRVKTAESLEQKLRDRARENKPASIIDIADLVGGRIVLLYFKDLEVVQELLLRNFQPVGEIIQHPQSEKNKSMRFRGYDGRHFRLKRRNTKHNTHPELVIEVQVIHITIWLLARVDHDTIYKQQGEVPEAFKQSIEMIRGVANLYAEAFAQHEKVFAAQGSDGVTRQKIQRLDYQIHQASTLQQYLSPAGKQSTSPDAGPVMDPIDNDSCFGSDLERSLIMILRTAMEVMNTKKQSSAELHNEHWLVPRSVSSFFTGRSDVLKRLRTSLCPSPKSINESRQRRFVIIGVGGAGKSEVCLKFAEDNKNRFWGIFWIDASNETTATNSFKTLAAECRINNDSLDGIRYWLANSKQSWLLIIDNADDVNFDYSTYIPSGTKGAVLITSRNIHCKQYNNVGHEFLNALDEEESTSLLFKTAEIDLDERFDQGQKAKEVARLLGYHALALTHAGAYIRHGICDLDEYADKFRTKHNELLRYEIKQNSSTHRTVYATFEISATRLMEASSSDQIAVDALELLKLLAFLHFNDVPVLMLQRAWTKATLIQKRICKDLDDKIEYLSPWHVSLLPGFMRPTRTEDLVRTSIRLAINLLQSYSLLSFNRKKKTLSMHPLVHTWAKCRLEREIQLAAWTATSSVIALSIKDTGDEELFQHSDMFWPHLKPHLNSWFEIQSENDFHLEVSMSKFQILFHFCWLFYGVRDDLRAERLAKLINSELNKDNQYMILQTAEFSKLEGQISYYRGQCLNAVKTLEKVFKLRNKILDPEHPSQLATQDDLAVAYMGLGKYQKSVEILEEVVTIRERVLDPEHPHRLASQQVLAVAYMGVGKHQKAVEILEVVTIQEQVLDPEHPHRLASQHELAGAYMGVGKHQKAVEILEEVVTIRERVLDPEHPHRLASQHELAGAYIGVGKHQKAVETLEEVVTIIERVLDPEHPHRLASQHELARAYMGVGKHQKAVEILEVVTIQERVLDPEHPSRSRKGPKSSRNLRRSGHDKRTSPGS